MSKTRMRKILSAVLLVILALYVSTRPESTAVSSIISPASSTSASISEWYPVVKVVDGDTIKIHKDGKDIIIRLIGVDTPETVDPRKTVQCFGKAASDETKKVLEGQLVRIETDASQGEFDTYGRTLAYMYAPSNSDPAGLQVNKYLIAEGFAHEYTYNIPYKYQSEFKAAETSAREQKKGLWADAACAEESSRAK